MKKNIFIASLAVIVASMHVWAQPGSGYHVADTIAIGGASKWDFCSIEPSTHRLFVSHGTSVAVVDLATRRLLKEIAGLNNVHGIAFATEASRGFISSGGDNTVAIFDLSSLAIIGRIVVGEKPDAIIYEPFSKKIICCNAGGSSVTVIDPSSAQVVTTITLGGNPEFAASDGAGKLFVNLEMEGAINVIDTKSFAVLAKWPLAPCTGPTGMAVDPEHKRIFSGGRNKLLAVVDATTGSVSSTLPIGAGVDACAFDPSSKFIFTSNKEGTLTILEEQTPDTYRVVENVKTSPGSKTMALDVSDHRIYLPASIGGSADKKSGGNFCVLVFAR